MQGDTLARGGRSANFPGPAVSADRWQSATGDPLYKKPDGTWWFLERAGEHDGDKEIGPFNTRMSAYNARFGGSK